MTPSLSSDLKGRILALGALKWSQRLIVSELRKSNIIVSQKSVSNILKISNDGTANQSIDPPRAKTSRRPSVMTPRKVRKVKQYIALDNSPTQRCMAKRVGASAASINNVIHGRLKKQTIKKVKVHRLTPAAIKKRKERALPFYNLIKDGQYEYILTMDEAMLPFDPGHGQRDFYYDEKIKENRRDQPPLKVRAPAHAPQRMFAAGYTWRGPTRLYVVDKDVKVNGELFLEQILKPMLQIDLPNLYGADADKVVLHMDSASSHTSKLVTDWLKDNNYNFFSKEQWLANSPEVSPMDFFANGYLKSELARRKYRTMDGMIAAANDEWQKIPLEMFKKSLCSWPDRVLAIHKARGDSAPKYKK